MDMDSSTSPAVHHATQLLVRVEQGSRTAANELATALYEDLRSIAAAHMRRERGHHTLQATAVVHEAYLRLIDQRDVMEQGKRQFLALAAGVIRRVLIDHARAVRAEKRGGGERPVTLQESMMAIGGESLDVIAVDDAITALAALEPRHARLVELKFFSGLSNEEIAMELGVSMSTVEKDWRFVRSWLRRKL